MKPQIRIHNTETDEIVDREMNDKEFADYEAREAEAAKQQTEAAAKDAARAALLDKLGITADEAALLLG